MDLTPLYSTLVWNHSTLENANTVSHHSSASEVPHSDPFKFLLIRLWMRRILLPFLIVSGVFGNVMVVVIVARLWARRSAMNVYFLCLAISDFCVIVTGPLEIWVQSTFEVRILALNEVVCKLNGFVFSTAVAVSAWIVLALVVQRAFSVVWPHKVGVMCTVKKTWITICIIVIVLSLAFSHLLYGMTTKENFCDFRDDYLPFLLDVWGKVDIFLVSAVPLCGLCCSNFVLVVKLRASVKMAGEEFAASDKQQVERRRKVNSTSVTALLVSVAFMVFTLPIAVWNTILYLPTSNPQKSAEQMSFDYFLQAFFYCLLYVNFSINFYLYCLTGQKFRNEFRTIVCGLVSCVRSPRT